MADQLPKSGEPLWTCVCGSTGPFAVVERMVQGFTRKGRALPYLSGCLVSCQACARFVLFGPGGRMPRHPNAWPILDPAMPRGTSEQDAEPPVTIPPRSLPPLPKERPMV